MRVLSLALKMMMSMLPVTHDLGHCLNYEINRRLAQVLRWEQDLD